MPPRHATRRRVWRRERTAVHADDAVVYDDGEGEEVEHVCEIRPDVRRVVLAQAFRVEPIRLSNKI